MIRLTGGGKEAWVDVSQLDTIKKHISRFQHIDEIGGRLGPMLKVQNSERKKISEGMFVVLWSGCSACSRRTCLSSKMHRAWAYSPRR